jgi:hypothetical protein
MVKAGIDRHFSAYSARHALMTLLLRLGFSEVEVNAYTGHSNNSHTALAHYFHLDGNWAGKKIVQEALRVVPEKAEEITERDNKVQREEEGEELDVVAEADATGEVREELARFDWGGERSTEREGTASERRTSTDRKGTGGRISSQGVDKAALRERVLDGLGQGQASPPPLRRREGQVGGTRSGAGR